MTNVELLIKNGSVCIPELGTIEADIAVKDHRIAAISKSEVFSADRVVDATGKIVVPGFIDTHAHFREPGLTYKEDFETGSKAAAAGGITFFVDMPNTKPPPNTLDLYKQHRELAEKKSVVDFNHWALPTVLEEIPKIVEAGASGFKFFMKTGVDEVYPYNPAHFVGDDFMILQIFQAIAKTGMPVLVHPWNQPMWIQVVKSYRQKGLGGDLKSSLDALLFGDCVLYTSAISKLLEFKRVSGVKLHVLHINWKPCFDLIRHAKSNGFDITCELNPWQCIPFHTEAGLKVTPRAALGAHYGHVDELWRALNDGTVDVIASDHSPHSTEEMQVEKSFEGSGVNYLEHMMPILLTFVNEGKLPLERLVVLSSQNPARLAGVYPRKGAIKLGSDADLVVLDMKKRMKISAEKMYSKHKISGYEGREVRGLPVVTIVRGTVVMQDGEVIGKPGYGEFIPSTK